MINDDWLYVSRVKLAEEGRLGYANAAYARDVKNLLNTYLVDSPLIRTWRDRVELAMKGELLDPMGHYARDVAAILKALGVTLEAPNSEGVELGLDSVEASKTLPRGLGEDNA